MPCPAPELQASTNKNTSQHEQQKCTRHNPGVGGAMRCMRCCRLLGRNVELAHRGCYCAANAQKGRCCSSEQLLISKRATLRLCCRPARIEPMKGQGPGLSVLAAIPGQQHNAPCHLSSCQRRTFDQLIPPAITASSHNSNLINCLTNGFVCTNNPKQLSRAGARADKCGQPGFAHGSD
jgi:hypothetical protein